jgi:membrane protein involved in colicin uptake
VRGCGSCRVRVSFFLWTCPRLENEADTSMTSHALARQMQTEEDERAREIHTRRHQALERRRRAEEEERQRRETLNKGRPAASGGKTKKNKNCVVM